MLLSLPTRPHHRLPVASIGALFAHAQPVRSPARGAQRVLAALTVGMALFSGCGTKSEPASVSSEKTIPVLQSIGQAAYTVAWHSTQLKPVDATQHGVAKVSPKGATNGATKGSEPSAASTWQLTNDKGFVIELNRAYLATYTVQGIRCQGAGAAPAAVPSQPPGSLGDLFWLLNPLGSNSARAGHGKTLQESAIRTPWVENMLEGKSQTFPAITFTPYPICEIHYLVARANEESLNRPTDPDMLRQSLYVEGSFADKEGKPHPFILKTSTAHAKVQDVRAITQVPGAGVNVGGAYTPQQLTVTVTRTLDGLFDGVDLSPLVPLTMGSPEWTTAETKIARQLLKNVIDHTVIEAQVTKVAGQAPAPSAPGQP